MFPSVFEGPPVSDWPRAFTHTDLPRIPELRGMPGRIYACFAEKEMDTERLGLL